MCWRWGTALHPLHKPLPDEPGKRLVKCCPCAKIEQAGNGHDTAAPRPQPQQQFFTDGMK